MLEKGVIAKRTYTEKELQDLNTKYKPLTIEERIAMLYEDFSTEEIMLTSSFAATSAFLLHLFSTVNKDQKVYFIDTGFHFPETLDYKKKLTDLYGLNVESISAIKEEHEFTVQDETYRKNPEFCCTINKVKPLDQIKKKFTVWVSGLMEWQSDHRSTLNVFEERGNIIKFYPLLDVSKEQRDAFIAKHKLPFHPLVFQGYNSIGCKHCTVPGEDRSGRWNNSPKTECGLHL